MSEEKNINQQPQNTPSIDKRTDVKIERARTDENISPRPLSWQPVRDQTGTNPPDGGSGSGDNKEK